MSIPICDHGRLTTCNLIAIVPHRKWELICIVLLKDVVLLLVEELYALLSVTQKHVFGVEYNFVAGFMSVNASIDVQLATKVILERDGLLIVTCLISLLQDQTFLWEALIVQVKQNIDLGSQVVHCVPSHLFASLEGELSKRLPINSISHSLLHRLENLLSIVCLSLFFSLENVGQGHHNGHGQAVLDDQSRHQIVVEHFFMRC